MFLVLWQAERVFDCMYDYSYHRRFENTVCIYLYARPSFPMDDTVTIRINNITRIRYGPEMCVSYKQSIKFVNITKGNQYCVHLFLLEGKQTAELRFRPGGAIVRVQKEHEFAYAQIQLANEVYNCSRIFRSRAMTVLLFDGLPVASGLQYIMGYSEKGQFYSMLAYPAPLHHHQLQLQLSGHAKLYTGDQEVPIEAVLIYDMNAFTRLVDVQDSEQLTLLRNTIVSGDFFRVYAGCQDFGGLVTEFSILPDHLEYSNSLDCITIPKHDGTLYAICGSALQQQTDWRFCQCVDFRAALVYSGGRYYLYYAKRVRREPILAILAIISTVCFLFLLCAFGRHAIAFRQHADLRRELKKMLE